MTTDDRSQTPPHFPVWRGLSLVEELVVAPWQDASPSALQALSTLSEDERTALIDIFETFVVAAHYLTGATAKMAERADPTSHCAPEPDGVSANGSNQAEDQPRRNALWALREFLGLIETFVSLLSATDEEARLVRLERRVSLYDRVRLTWLTRAGETVSAACGLVLLRVDGSSESSQ